MDTDTGGHGRTLRHPDTRAQHAQDGACVRPHANASPRKSPSDLFCAARLQLPPPAVTVHDFPPCFTVCCDRKGARKAQCSR